MTQTEDMNNIDNFEIKKANMNLTADSIKVN
jgi:hypothetical protein